MRVTPYFLRKKPRKGFRKAFSFFQNHALQAFTKAEKMANE